jgi:hypothetical protein
MSDNMSFMAEDAFQYVDVYRKALDWPPEKISQKIAWLLPKINGEEEYDSKVYAEFRAYEHALKYLTDRVEPQLVFLGKDAERKRAEHEETVSDEEQIEMLRERVQKLREELAYHKKKQTNIDTDLSRCRSELASNQTKLSNCQSIQYLLLVAAGAFFFLTVILAFVK